MPSPAGTGSHPTSAHLHNNVTARNYKGVPPAKNHLAQLFQPISPGHMFSESRQSGAIKVGTVRHTRSRGVYKHELTVVTKPQSSENRRLAMGGVLIGLVGAEKKHWVLIDWKGAVKGKGLVDMNVTCQYKQFQRNHVLLEAYANTMADL